MELFAGRQRGSVQHHGGPLRAAGSLRPEMQQHQERLVPGKRLDSDDSIRRSSSCNDICIAIIVVTLWDAGFKRKSQCSGNGVLSVDGEDDDDDVEWEDVDVSEECGTCGGTGILAANRTTPRVALQVRNIT